MNDMSLIASYSVRPASRAVSMMCLMDGDLLTASLRLSQIAMASFNFLNRKDNICYVQQSIYLNKNSD